MRRATFSSSALSTGLDYGASYGCASDSPELIVTRATEAAKFGEGASGWSGYSLLTNNCETFAYWCSTGRRASRSKGLSWWPSVEIIILGFVAGGGGCVGGGGSDGSGGCAEPSFFYLFHSPSLAAVCTRLPPHPTAKCSPTNGVRRVGEIWLGIWGVGQRAHGE